MRIDPIQQGNHPACNTDEATCKNKLDISFGKEERGLLRKKMKYMKGINKAQSYVTK